MKGKLGALTAMAIMFGALDNTICGDGKLSESDIDFTPKEPPTPKGCKRYYYNENGVCSKSESKIYFDAMKPSTARAKYERWKSNISTQ